MTVEDRGAEIGSFGIELEYHDKVLWFISEVRSKYNLIRKYNDITI